MPAESDASPRPLGPPAPLSGPAYGLAWRALSLADNPALVALVARIEEHDNPPYRTTEEESAENFAEAGTDPARDTIGGFDDDGQIRAFGMVRMRTGATGPVRALAEGGVDPQWRQRGIGAALLAWQVARTRQRLSDGAAGLGRVVVHVEDGMDDTVALLRRAGFTPQRWYTEMRRDLSTPIPDVELASRLRVEPWTPELDDAVRRAHNDAFRDQWGAQEHTPETWVQGRTHFAPAWSFVALDRTSDRARVAGYLISGRYEHDWPAQGWSEGYTEVLGVRREWRGKRIATALLTTAMRAYAADGMEYAGLGVEAAAPTGEFGLFTHLGYEPTRGSTLYTLELGA
ncbi:GNAT family N-acetyltransferase [Georgenia faecalis]|uniref:GNAT family N-acetyltransferase n=1 Tax=Georgenia faecalis TaxID=2483799 RepID=A0ABV9DDL4_9MICO|nr:GNAT family N-acetyltransferase [Georgenia faecalis]